MKVHVIFREGPAHEVDFSGFDDERAREYAEKVVVKGVWRDNQLWPPHRIVLVELVP